MILKQPERGITDCIIVLIGRELNTHTQVVCFWKTLALFS